MKMKKNLIKQYAVNFHETGYEATTQQFEVMDGKCLAGLSLDTAFTITNVVRITYKKTLFGLKVVSIENCPSYKESKTPFNY